MKTMKDFSAVLPREERKLHCLVRQSVPNAGKKKCLNDAFWIVQESDSIQYLTSVSHEKLDSIQYS